MVLNYKNHKHTKKYMGATLLLLYHNYTIGSNILQQILWVIEKGKKYFLPLKKKRFYIIIFFSTKLFF